MAVTALYGQEILVEPANAEALLRIASALEARWNSSPSSVASVIGCKRLSAIPSLEEAHYIPHDLAALALLLAKEFLKRLSSQNSLGFSSCFSS